MNPQEFAKKIKSKYPQYKNVDDIELARSIVQKYPQYQSSVDFSTIADKKDSQGFISETKEDIRQIVTGTAEDLEKRADITSEISQARRTGEQGVIRSLFQRFGQGAGAASDVIGRTVIGAGKVLLPQRTEEAIQSVVQKGVQTVSELPPVQNLLERFEKLKEENPALARDIDSALGIGTLALDIGTAGLGGQAVKTGVKGAGKTAELAAKGAGKAGAGARRIGFELEGALTGTSQETLEQAFQAARQGGKELETLTENLRGRVTPEELVENVRQSADVIATRRSTDFKNSFEPIANLPVDASDVKPSVISKMDEFKSNG